VTPWGIAQTCITAIMGMICVGAAVEGWYWTRMSWWERITILAGGLLLIVPGTITDLIGLGLMALITLTQYYRARTTKTVTTTSDSTS
jgi:TRAP-type uncharacterized transport system fused permease subunit